MCTDAAIIESLPARISMRERIHAKRKTQNAKRKTQNAKRKTQNAKLFSLHGPRIPAQENRLGDLKFDRLSGRGERSTVRGGDLRPWSALGVGRGWQRQNTDAHLSCRMAAGQR